MPHDLVVQFAKCFYRKWFNVDGAVDRHDGFSNFIGKKMWVRRWNRISPLFRSTCLFKKPNFYEVAVPEALSEAVC